MTGPYLVRHLERWTETIDEITREQSRVVSVKAFETLEEARDEALRIIQGAFDPTDPLRDVARRSLASLPAEGGKVELPDGREIVVETTSWSDLAAAVDYLGRGFVREEEWPEVLAAFNAALAERYGTEARA